MAKHLALKLDWRIDFPFDWPLSLKIFDCFLLFVTFDSLNCQTLVNYVDSPSKPIVLLIIDFKNVYHFVEAN